MALEYGDMLWMDHPLLGKTLYMVAEPPLECPHCGHRLVDWERDEAARAVLCPECGARVPEDSFPVCRRCGGRDQIALVIAANNAFGLGSDGEMTSYNHAVNRHLAFCRKSVEAEIKAGLLRLLPPREAVMRKRLIAWTTSDRYEEGKPIPKEIEEQFPMPE